MGVSRRNCDRFDTLDQAREAYRSECCYWFGDRDGVGGTYLRRSRSPPFEAWLFKDADVKTKSGRRQGNT